MSPLYARELIGWAVNVVGRAFGWSLLAPFVLAIIGYAAEATWLLGAAALSGPVVFVIVLANSRPPWPSDVEDDVPEDVAT